ncbi:hypothetical protein C343_07022 [Cryptococcus neoformans C23]|uniref:Uncharacterized protein n=2 Tax=Cryptococcus neoformans TaxID=5207 RepID=A0A854QHJ9_CRYNE|nr:hypothetical protein CNAG_07888 [Cryptococcus neoformans var. grubii H99]AUB29266.1 hypothetical protein CKF44_07888 [Cryptococcus neoformans var. grubii]OWZ25980.1 hypothetical protein C347_06949 [Cryptococcus neoformans var. grubii AD2-60a]OWZ26110.1 hypothetical protein C353_07061 [Cryptococcus neoformans var. grubii AD1-83a]OWZ38009.1 hypothetical protein C343_07022 [Cryptococcus neoformans var. grubii C23]OWZ49752.1 hypothetical protein C368_07026 [Cryptococcus neoformans var. grubii 1|eukprot:XP_012053937.1 hypothetical protein CNAG_07888 [Cryptococcus neoformans var. grubii H99]
MAPCVCLTTLLSCSPRRCSLANLSAAPSSKHQHKHLSTARLIFDCLSCFTAVPHIAICLVLVCFSRWSLLPVACASVSYAY